MRLLSLFGRQEKREDSPPVQFPRNDTTSDFWFMPLIRNAAGSNVTPESAIRLVAVYACVRVIAESIAQLPLILYRRLPEGGKERATDMPLHRVVGFKPNKWQTHFEFVEMMTGHMLLRGNAYAEIIKNGAGTEVKELWPLHPSRVRTELQESGEKIHIYRDNKNQETQLASKDVLHLRGLSFDGVTGLSPITVGAEAIGLGLSMQEYGARFFENDATPGGVITYPNKLTQVQVENIRESWNKKHKGVKNKHRTAIFEEGMAWQAVGVSPEVAQLLDSRRFTLEEIARLFRVQPHMIQDLMRATFSNIEHQGIDFVTHTLGPWFKRWEEALTISLLPEKLWGVNFFEFLQDAFLRGDTVTRFTAYKMAIDGGWLNRDEVRERENLNPIPDGAGKTFSQPLNMTTLGATEEEQPAQEPTKLTLVKNEPEADVASRSAAFNLEAIKFAYSRAFEEAAARVIRRESRELVAAVKKVNFVDAEACNQFSIKWCETYRGHARDAVEGLVHTCCAMLYASRSIPNVEEPSSESVKAQAEALADLYWYGSVDLLHQVQSVEDVQSITGKGWERERAKSLADRWVRAMFCAEKEERMNGTEP
jgi:HK97 family phage portal protein